MKRQTLLLVILSALLLAACNNSYSTVKSSELNSVTSEETSSTSELPDAPLDQIRLTVENFAYDGDISVPVITGLESRGIRAKYTYHDLNTKEYIDIYDAGKKNYIEIGTYLLKAEVTCFSYKPFTLETTFSVLKATMNVSIEAHDYYYDDIVPQPYVYGVPYSAERTLHYYTDSNNKKEFNYNVENTIVPGTYILEVTATDPRYESGFATDTFNVFKAQFDERYELQETNVDLGALDTGFSIYDVDLDNLLHIVDLNKDEIVSGVHFIYKEDYVFTAKQNKVVVIAQKEHFEDKEYEIEFTCYKTEVEVPYLESVDGEPDLNQIVYDGTEKTVRLANLDEARVSVDYAVFSATNPGTYTIKVNLKDPVYTCWKNGSNEELTFTWTIVPYRLKSYRLVIGDFVGQENETHLKIPYSNFANPVDVDLQYKNNNGEWVSYEYQEIIPFDPGYDNAHYDENGKYVIDNRDQICLVHIGTSNPNHRVDFEFHIYAYEVLQLTYTPDNRMPLWWGYLPVFLDYGNSTCRDDCLLEVSTNGGYFAIQGTLTHVEFATMTFNVTSNIAAFRVRCVLSEDTEGTVDVYEKVIEVEAGYNGAELMIDFRDTYDVRTGAYFMKFFVEGETTQTLELSALTIQYIRIVG